jgi:hypothetical protein
MYPSVQVFAGLRSFIFCTSPDTIRQIKSRRIEVGGACSTYGRGEKIEQGFAAKARGKETAWKTKTQMAWDQNGS